MELKCHKCGGALQHFNWGHRITIAPCEQCALAKELREKLEEVMSKWDPSHIHSPPKNVRYY